MFHKTIRILCLLLITIIPVNVHALGFGIIRVNSALNEIMDAEIPVTVATKEEAESLEVKLATAELFQRFGTDRPTLLTSLKFEVKQKSGLTYIRITSTKAIREPYLDFWLELTTNSQKLTKSFVVLLDLPKLKQADPVSIVEAPIAAEIEPEAIIDEAVDEPQASPFTDAEPSILDAEPLADTAAAEPELLFPSEATVGDQEETQVESEQIVDAEPIELISEPGEVEPLIVEDQQDGRADTLDDPVAELEPEQIIADESDIVLEDTEAESFAAEDGLFPRIPLSNYTEPTEAQFDAEPAFVDQVNDAQNGESIAQNEFTDDPSSSEQQASQGLEESATSDGGLDYGITKKNDNLWQIAEKLRAGSSSSTVYQIMMALLQSNPDAFIDNNVHRLKIGYVLRVEDPGLLTQMTTNQASQMYQEQTDQWNNYRQNIASNVDTQAVDTSDVSFTDTEADAEITEGELTLTTPDSADAEISEGLDEPAADAQQLSDLAILRDDLKRAISEASTSSDSQNPELNKRLLDLEDEINSMQRMLTVEDNELATLQQQLHEINERNAAIAEETQLAIANPETIGDPEEIDQAQLLEADNVEPPIDEVPVDDVIAEQEQITDTEIPPAVTAEDDGIVSILMGLVSGVITTIISNIIYVGGAIAGLILLILTVVLLKRRSANNDGSNESILIGSEESDIVDFGTESDTTSGPVSAGVDSTSSEESSFLSDFAISGMNAIEEDNEVDPLTEADVFMAYGRYEAAEERLQDAIKSDPNRSELKLKLIELYYTTKNKESFESAAEEFYASLGGNAGADPMWEKVLSMGAEIAPSNPIFSGGTPPEDGMNVSSASMSKSDVMDIGLDTGVFDSDDLSTTSTDTSAPAETALDTSADYNFDLGIDTTGDLTGDIAKEQSSGLEFDLNLDAQDSGTADDSNTLDFNIDSGESTEQIDAAGSSSMEFDLGSNIESDSELMDLGLDDTNSTAEIDASGLDFDLPGDNDMGLDDDLDLGSGMDEVGTKLDLAKAYIDMGDSNGARSILDEVIDEGNDSQKQEAQELIHQIV